MKTVNFKYKSNIPSEITCVGTQYEDTKELSLGELTLFIESKLMELSNEYYETSIKFAIQLTESDFTKEKKYLVLITAKDFIDYLHLSNQVEEILWSFNKQVFHQNGGRFFSHYVRFSYLLKKNIEDNTELRKVS
ncbi:MAG: hypothetical protein CME70_15560 [Halobacteriovorax sp.]|nr:hypothetical protein [Halobacteriovorax sp.]